MVLNQITAVPGKRVFLYGKFLLGYFLFKMERKIKLEHCELELLK